MYTEQGMQVLVLKPLMHVSDLTQPTGKVLVQKHLPKQEEHQCSI